MSRIWTLCELLLLLVAILSLGLPTAQAASEFKKGRVGSDREYEWRFKEKVTDCGILPVVSYLGSSEKPAAKQSGVGWLVNTPVGPRVLTPAHVALGASGIVVYCKAQEYHLEVEHSAVHYDLAVLKSKSGANRTLRNISRGEALVSFPLSASDQNIANQEKERWKQHSQGAQPTLTSVLVGIDHSIPAPKAPELWLTGSLYENRRSPFDTIMSPGVRPGFSGAAVISRIPDDRVLPIAMIQQTMNPGSQARGLSIGRISDLVLGLLGHRQSSSLLSPPMQISWQLRSTPQAVHRSRSLVLQNTRNGPVTISETCTSSLYSQVSSWGPVGGADWGDGGGADWADGGEGAREGNQENPEIPRERDEGHVNFNWGQLAGEGASESEVQGMNMNFFPVPFIYYRANSGCKKVGLQLPDGRVFVGLKVPESRNKNVVFPMRELEDLIDLFQRLTPEVKEKNRLKFIEKHAIWLPASSRMQLPICQAFPQGLFANQGEHSFDYGEVLKRFKSVVPHYFKERAGFQKGVHLSVECLERGTKAQITHKDFAVTWSSLGVQGWVLVDGVKHNVARSVSDPFSFQISAAGTTVHFSGLTLSGHDSVDVHLAREGGTPWMEHIYYGLYTREDE